MFMRALGQRARQSGRVYLAGGASAVLKQWRPATIDIDLELDPELEPLLREIVELKEVLQVKVELAKPGHFIPPVPGWRERSPFISREGSVSFHHYDFCAQALAKIERGHTRDQEDVAAMFHERQLLLFYDAIEPELYRYPAIDAASFRRAVQRTVDRYPE
jgi:hypothetical protein